MSERTGCLVVDADGHVIERPEMWADYLEAEYRGRAPRIVQPRTASLRSSSVTG